jgi:hypothetical protein
MSSGAGGPSDIPETPGTYSSTFAVPPLRLRRSGEIPLVRVSGAGLDGANGIYVQDGACDGALKFTKKGFWRGHETIFSLYRYDMGGKIWFISIVPVGHKPGTKSDKDFYCTSTSSQDTD